MTKVLSVLVAALLGFAAGRTVESRERQVEPSNRERVTGIGGIFFKAKEPAVLSAWYREHLGLELQGGAPERRVFEWREKDNPQRVGRTVWALFRNNTKYFEPSQVPFMINYRVRNLDRMLRQLRGQGVGVDARMVKEFNGRFAWIMDPEGNRIELWEPAEGW